MMNKNVLLVATLLATSPVFANTSPYETQVDVLAANVPEKKAEVVGVNGVAVSNSYTAGGAVVNGYNGIAIGVETKVEKHYGIAIGSQAESTAEEGVAVGEDATASGASSMALGSQTEASGNAAIAMGRGAISSHENTTAVGSGSVASAKHSTAIGTDANASEIKASAFGIHASAEADSSVAVGADTKAQAQYATSVGVASIADGKAAVAVGLNTKASGGQAIAVGRAADASGEWSIAQGSAAKATELNAVAIGTLAVATDEGAVALGSESETKAHQLVTEATVNGITYDGFAGTPVAVVSVGKAGAERQLVNVAPGEISDTSTDAINGSQLYMVAEAVGTNQANIIENRTNIAANKNAIEVNAENIATNERAIEGNYQAIMHNEQNIIALQEDQIRQDKDIKAAKTEVRAGKHTTVVNVKGADGQDSYTVNALRTDVEAGSTAVKVNSNFDAASSVITAKVDLSDDSKSALERARTALQDFIVSVDGTQVNTLNQTNNQQGFVSGKNVKLSSIDGNVVVSTTDDVEFQNAVAKAFRSGDVVVSANEVNVAGNQIKNVAAGEVSATSTDAVNGSQLHATNVAVNNLSNKVDGVQNLFGDLSKQVKDLHEEMDGGFAGLNAAAALPQAHRAGQSSIAAAVGAYGDAQALAIGVSTISDSGRWTVKGQANLNTEGKVGGAVGVAFNF